MKKLSEINEGMFSGIIRRSNSEQVKKEDEINDEWHIDDFMDYLKERYKPLYENIDIKIPSSVNILIVPIIEISLRTTINLLIHERHLINHFEITIMYEIKNLCPDIYKILEDNYDIYSRDLSELIILPKDNKKVTLEFFMDVLNTILNNTDSPAIEKIK